jgi:type IV pilus assembly protein PilF
MNTLTIGSTSRTYIKGFGPLLVCVYALMLMLAGCAGTKAGGENGTDGAAQGDVRQLQTQSDEPELRKRARLRMELASGYLERGNPNTALDEVKQALAVDPNYADAYTMRGLIYMQMQQGPLAEQSFKQALQLEPRNPDALHNYGWFLCRNQRLPEAIERFKLATQNVNYPGLDRTYLVLGICQMQGGFMADAEKSLYRSFELDPGNPATATNLALLHFRKKDLEKARFYARKVNNSELANSESLWLGMRIEKGLGNLLAVNEIGTQLKRRFPESREVKLFDRGAFDEQ